MTRRGAKRSANGTAGLATLAVLGSALAAPAVAQQSAADPHAPAAIAATVHELRTCIRQLSARDRFLLSFRFGVGGRPQKTDAEVAARLHTTTGVVAAREIIVVRRLEAVHRRGVCAGGQVTATAASSAPALSPTGGSSRSSGGGISSDEILAGAVILAALLVAGREFRKAIFGPPPRH